VASLGEEFPDQSIGNNLSARKRADRPITGYHERGRAVISMRAYQALRSGSGHNGRRLARARTADRASTSANMADYGA
jgi:hypothetical protein